MMCVSERWCRSADDGDWDDEVRLTDADAPERIMYGDGEENH